LKDPRIYAYCIVGYFPEVEIFLNFPNGFMTRENLFWTADCFRRLNCGIEILGILA